MKKEEHIETYLNILKDAQVEIYAKEQVIFCKDRVGVVITGSIDIRNHQNTNLLKPFKVHKAVEGDIIGFERGDMGITVNPLTWMVSKQDYTEVAYFEIDQWEKLWKL